MPNIKVEGRSEGLGFVPTGQVQEQNLGQKVADETGPWAAMAKAGEAVSDITNKLIAADAAVKTQKAKLEFDSAMEQHVAQMKMRADHQKIPADHAAGVAEIQKNFQEKYAGVWDRIAPYADHKAAIAGVHVGYHVNTLFLNEIKGDYVMASNELIKRAAFAQTKEEKDAHEAAFNDLTNETKGYGAISAVDAANNTLQFKNKVDLFKFTDVLTKNPTLAKQMLLEKDANGMPLHFPNLTTDQYGHALGQVEEKIRFERNEAHRQEKELQDYTAQEAYRMMADPKTPDAAKVSWIRQQYTTMRPDGTYAMDARTGYHLEQSIINGEHYKTDNETFYRLLSKSLPTPTDPAGTLTMDDINYAVAAKRLSPGDAKSLITRVATADTKAMTGEQKIVDHELKTAMEDMKNLLDLKVVLSDTETSKAARGFIMRDLTRVADYVRTPAQVQWFKETYIPQIKAKIAGQETNESWMQDYAAKLEAAPESAYQAMFHGKRPKSSDVYYKRNQPTGGPSAPTATQSPVASAAMSPHSNVITTTFGEQAGIFSHVGYAESGGREQIISKPNKNGTRDWGLYQINDVNHPDLIKAGKITQASDLLNAKTNAECAKWLYDRNGLLPWKSSIDKWGRPAAMDVLRAAGKPVTEKNIQFVQDQFLAPKKKGNK